MFNNKPSLEKINEAIQNGLVKIEELSKQLEAVKEQHIQNLTDSALDGGTPDSKLEKQVLNLERQISDLKAVHGQLVKRKVAAIDEQYEAEYKMRQSQKEEAYKKFKELAAEVEKLQDQLTKLESERELWRHRSSVDIKRKTTVMELHSDVQYLDNPEYNDVSTLPVDPVQWADAVRKLKDNSPTATATIKLDGKGNVATAKIGY